MSRPHNVAKPRVKPSTVYRGLFVCFNNAAYGYGETIADAYKNWQAHRAIKGIRND